MKPALIDTDILSMFFRNNRNVVSHFETYLKEFSKVSISIVTYYEILSGLKYRDSRKQLDNFLEFSSASTILPLTEDSCSIAADLYAQLRRNGQPIGDVDLMIAGIALSNDLVLATHNQRHFERIENLEIEDWSQVFRA